MTQVARVFVVLNLLLAAGFLFSVATILSLNQDYKTKLEGEQTAHGDTRTSLTRNLRAVEGERDDARRASEELRQKSARLESTNAAQAQQITSLEGDKSNLETANSQMRQELDNLAAGVNRLQEDNNRLMAESKKNADQARASRAEALAAAEDLEAERKKNQDLTVARTNLEEERGNLQEVIKEKDTMLDYAREKGINFENLVSMKNAVHGVVVQADNETRLAVINRGKNSGVERGYVLDIVRGGSYIGRMLVDSVHEQAAAGTIKFLSPGQSVMPGDEVTNKLN